MKRPHHPATPALRDLRALFRCSKAGYPRGTVVRALGGTAERIHVRLPHSKALIALSYEEVEPAKSPIDHRIDDNRAQKVGNYIYSQPGPNGVPVEKINGGEALTLLGTNGSYLFVSTDKGSRGWIKKL